MNFFYIGAESNLGNFLFPQGFNIGDIGDTLAQGERQRIFILENTDGSIFRFEAEIKATPKWSSEFKHGAEIYIGLYDGITFFLGNRIENKKLIAMEKIKFRRPTDGNIIYSIFTSENKGLETESNVFGSFVDNEGNRYYYYGADISNSRKSSDGLMLDRYYEQMIGQDKLKEPISFEVGQTQVFQLGEITGSLDNRTKGQISNQSEIIHSLILDVVNKICIKSDRFEGVVTGYENISYSSSGDYGDILNGTCKIEITKISQFKSNTSSYYYRCFQFCVFDGSGNELLSGFVKFAEPLEE